MQGFVIGEWPVQSGGKMEGVQAPDIHRVPSVLKKMEHHKGKAIESITVDGHPGVSIDGVEFRILTPGVRSDVGDLIEGILEMNRRKARPSLN